MTANQKEYKKQINRIKNFIKRKEKEGFVFTEFPKDMPSLTVPKRVTKKALENIQSFRTQSLYKGSIFVSPEGTTTGLEEVRRRKKAAGKKRSISMRSKNLKRITPDEARQKGIKIIEYMPKFDLIDSLLKRIKDIERKADPKYNLEKQKGVLVRTFEDTINVMDHQELIEYLYSFQDEIMHNIGVVEFYSGQEDVNAGFTRLLEILNVDFLTTDQLQEISDFNERASYLEAEMEV